MNTETDNNVKNYKKLSVYNNTLFAIGAACVIAGLFYPAIPGLVDVLLIFSFSLCAAVIVISFSSKKPSELSGFSMLAVAAVAILLTANIASAKLVLLKATASNIINFAAAINLPLKIMPDWLTAILFSTVSIVLLIAVRRKNLKIVKGSSEFLEEISAVQTAQVENDFAVIDTEQNDLLAQQKGFFFSTAAFGKFSFCITVIICFVILFGIAVSLVLSAAKISAPTQGLTTLVSSCGVFILLMLFLSVAAVSRFITKSSVALIEQTRLTEEQSQERIKVTAREIAASQIIYPWHTKEPDDESLYEMTTEMLAESSRNKVTLMASENPNNLPVTIPVNTAMKLARDGRKTLIIDFDLKRSAISKVFEIKDCQTKVVRTAIENLYLLSAQKLAKVSGQNLQRIFNKLNDSFDRIIIYAPDANELINKTNFFEHITSAMLFGEEHPQPSAGWANSRKLIEHLQENDCRILQRQDVLETV